MKAADKKRIDDLERRVRELEARPYWPPQPIVIIQPARLPAYQPYVMPWPYAPTVQPAIIWGNHDQVVQPCLAPVTFAC